MAETHFERFSKVIIARFGEDGGNDLLQWAKERYKASGQDFIYSVLRPLYRASSEAENALNVRRYYAMLFAVLEDAAKQMEDPYDVKGLLDQPYVDLAMSFIFGEVGRSVGLAVVGQMFLQMTWHVMAGRRVYEVSPGLGQRLAHTELRGLTTDDLKLPYRSVYLVVPKEAGLKIQDAQTGVHRMVGAYITEVNMDGVRQWNIMAIGEEKEVNGNGGFMDDSLLSFVFDLEEGASLTDALDTSDKKFYEFARKHRFSDTEFLAVKTQWRDIFAWSMNAIIYATWPDADRFDVVCNPEYRKAQEKMKKHPKGSHQYEKAIAIVRSQDAKHRILLGRNLSEWIEPTDTHHSEGQGTGKPLSVRTRVPGHWKRVVFGQGRAQRRWQFIEPYWRGPELGAERDSVHVLS